MGSWRTHFSYNEVSKVEQTDKKTYALSDGALFSVDKADNLLETYSKINGLNDFSITSIAYNSQMKLLLLAYSNGNIDLLADDGTTYNIPDIKNKIISVDKTPNDIFFKDEFGYISSAIGIVVVDLRKKEVADTYIIGQNSTSVKVNSVVVFKDSIYALTVGNEVYTAYSDNKFLVDYNNWKSRNWDFPDSDNSDNKKIVVFNDQLFLLKNSGKVYSSSDAQTWTLFDGAGSCENIRVSNNNLHLIASNKIVRYNSDMQPEVISGIETLDALYNQLTQTYWIASNMNGLLVAKEGSIIQQFKPQGPASNKVMGLAYQDDRMFAITGSKWDVEGENTPGAVMIFDKENWINFTKREMKDVGNDKEFIGVTSIAVDPKDSKHFFTSSWRDGMYEFRNNTFYKRYSEINSEIERSAGGNVDDYNNTDGLCFDKNGHLWFNNMLTTNSIKIFLNGNVETPVQLAYPPSNGGVLMKRESFDNTVVAQKNNFKWMNFRRTGGNGGIFIINDNNDPANIRNHQYIYYSSIKDQDGEEISLAPTYCFVEDHDGNMWCGTSMGPIIFKNVANVFNSSSYTVTRPKIPRNDGTDYADYLLSGVHVKSMAVDGGNRKWIGTLGAGVYLVSADGLKTVHHFTTENSPLLSNDIMAIGINDKTGEVFFATSLGLISYQSDATVADPEEKTYSSITVYPNPVRENFQGVITIKGLKENTTVKITDASGSMVYQTTSNGGMATWNGVCRNGKKATSGVYFVMASSADSLDSTQTGIGKFLIVK
jgi:hypothetical protein